MIATKDALIQEAKQINQDATPLRRRLEEFALSKFDGNKRLAATYLRNQATFYARKADRYYGKPLQRQWKVVSRAYSNAAYSLEYWLSVEDGLWESDDFDGYLS
jgi:hypothetical protein